MFKAFLLSVIVGGLTGYYLYFIRQVGMTGTVVYSLGIATAVAFLWIYLEKEQI